MSFLKRYSNTFNILLRVYDCLLLCSTGICIYALLMETWRLPEHYKIAIGLASVFSLLVFHILDLYKVWRGNNKNQETATILKAWFILFSLLTLAAFLSKSSELFSRQWLISWVFIGSTAHIISRIILRALLSYFRASGYNQRHIVIFGSSEAGQQVVERLTFNIAAGFHIMGYFSADKKSRVDVSGSIDEGIKFLSKAEPDQVWIAMPLSEEALIQGILKKLKNYPIEIRLVPDFFGFKLINHSISSVADLPVLNLSAQPMQGVNYWIKTIEDKTLASIILLVLSPLILLLSIGVKLSSPGPVFYRQERLSWNGTSFNMLKFRSMPVGIESKSGPVWAKEGEKRATPFGVFLRKTSLDELPQLWNVLIGDMSIVGPRPERPVFVEKLKNEVPGYMMKHAVKGGITGWAQVHGWRGNTDIHKRIEHDLYYIENWSLWMDLKIIILTLFKGLIHKNAY